MRSGLFTEIKNNPLALTLVIVFHLVLIVLLSINLASDDKPPMPTAKKHNIIDAVVVDAKKYDQREKQKKLTARKKIEDKKAAEKKRLADKKKKQELAGKKELEKKRQAEDKRKALALKKKKEANRKAKEKKVQEKKAREKKAREKKEKERIAKEKKARDEKERQLKEKQRLEAEKKRKLEEERKRRAEEKAEFERALIEEERREEAARLQAERAARLQTQLQQYIMQITLDVNNNWLRPVGTDEGQSCEIIVTQDMSGNVIGVQLQACSSDVAFQRSVESAVHKASPLPLPPDPALFERKIHFTFKPR